MSQAIEEIEQEYAKRITDTVTYLEKEKNQIIEAINKHTAALPRIQEIAGDCLKLWPGQRLDSLTIHLGAVPAGKKAKQEFYARMLALKRELGTLKVEWKDVHNARKKEIEVELVPANYPGVKIRYITKLPKDAKCQIQKRTQRRYVSHSLVCQS